MNAICCTAGSALSAKEANIRWAVAESDGRPRPSSRWRASPTRCRAGLASTSVAIPPAAVIASAPPIRPASADSNCAACIGLMSCLWVASATMSLTAVAMLICPLLLIRECMASSSGTVRSRSAQEPPVSIECRGGVAVAVADAHGLRGQEMHRGVDTHGARRDQSGTPTAWPLAWPMMAIIIAWSGDKVCAVTAVASVASSRGPESSSAFASCERRQRTARRTRARPLPPCPASRRRHCTRTSVRLVAEFHCAKARRRCQRDDFRRNPIDRSRIRAYHQS